MILNINNINAISNLARNILEIIHILISINKVVMINQINNKQKYYNNNNSNLFFSKKLIKNWKWKELV